MLVAMRYRTIFKGILLCLGACFLTVPAVAHPRDTGFLNRRIASNGTVYKFQVYVPEQWSADARWPVILFLHGRGERGSDGLDQTQVGLPAAIRSHPERWPFLVVMPQVPYNHWWTDPGMMAMAMAALKAATKEFRGDPQRTYITGLSMGAYGTWEMAKTYTGHFAAIVPVAGGVYWSYAPLRWRDTGLPAEYAARVGHTPVWLFHGTDDPVVISRQSVLLYEALKSAGGHVRLWEYIGMKHNAWDKAYAEPELPRWLLAHRLADIAVTEPYAERLLIPPHPAPARINPAIYDAYTGEYRDGNVVEVTVFRHGEDLFQKNGQGEITELIPENATTFFYPGGGPTRLTFEKDSTGAVKGLLYQDDRHEEHWSRSR